MKKRVAAFFMTIFVTVAGIPVLTQAEQLEGGTEASRYEYTAEDVEDIETEVKNRGSEEQLSEEESTIDTNLIETTEESTIEGKQTAESEEETEEIPQAEEKQDTKSENEIVILKDEDQESFVQENINAIADGSYTIRNTVNSAFTMDVAGGRTENGVNVQLYRYNETKAQVWKVSHDADGYVILQNDKSGKVLDVRNATAVNGANVWQYKVNGTDAQRWIAVKKADGSVVLHSALNRNYVMDLDLGIAQNSQNIQLYKEEETRAQKWMFQEYNETDLQAEKNKNALADGVYSIRNLLNTAYALDVAGGGVANGANVQLYRYNETKAQAWKISHDEKGYVTLVNLKSGKALAVREGSAANGTNIWQYDANGTIAQKWIAVKQQNGGIVLQSALNSGYVLDLYAGEVKNSQNIQLYRNNGTKAQQWSFQEYDENEMLAFENRNVIADGVYSIRNQTNTVYALDVAGAGTANGVNVQLYQYNGTKAQVWRVSHDSKGYVIITNVNSGRVLDVKGGQATNGANVQQYTRNDTKAQKWIALKQNDGTVKLVSALKPDVSLDLKDGMAGNSQNVQVNAGSSSNSQKWEFQVYTTADELANTNRGTIGSGIYAIRTAVNQSYTLEVKNGSNDNSANVQVYGYNRTNAQLWRITEDKCGYLTIINYKSGKALDIRGGQSVKGTNVQQYTANGSMAQKWIAIRQSDGSMKIVSALNSQLCLDLNNGTVANGQNVQIYTSNNTKAQRWFVTGARPLQASPLNTKVVVLDPGHNAKFTGAFYYNRQEHVMTLKVAQACKTYLESHYQNIEVYMTRETAAPLGDTIGDDLWARVELADQKNADILVSMHFNALNGAQDGALCFVSGQQNVSSQCQKLGNAILGKLQGLGLRNRGNQVTASKDYPGEDYYAINRLSARYGIPGIIVEHCFMDNAHDQIYIQSDTALQRLGYADAQGIAAYFGQ